MSYKFNPLPLEEVDDIAWFSTLGNACLSIPGDFSSEDEMVSMNGLNHLTLDLSVVGRDAASSISERKLRHLYHAPRYTVWEDKVYCPNRRAHVRPETLEDKDELKEFNRVRNQERLEKLKIKARAAAKKRKEEHEDFLKTRHIYLPLFNRIRDLESSLIYKKRMKDVLSRKYTKGFPDRPAFGSRKCGDCSWSSTCDLKAHNTDGICNAFKYSDKFLPERIIKLREIINGVKNDIKAVNTAIENTIKEMPKDFYIKFLNEQSAKIRRDKELEILEAKRIIFKGK